ncbi:LysM domain-containing protein [Evansella caseinilytica]|uniref:LysM domain-containing protein n=1 Tax=Evansella caseinilytica TaxID=1503961 RepID=A0A1H3UN52_9BACI|nr:LysM peptidoglycan-binding domain-containing protein [Evansella caseinilytica]SDZ63481.1 LysM domain-containing protein [Evansella caseinilytica]
MHSVLFTNHKITKNDLGYDIILYLNNKEEFAAELGTLTKESKKTLAEEAEGYVKQRFPNLRVNFVKFMMGGAILVSTMAVTAFKPGAASAAEQNGVTQQQTAQNKYTVKSGDTLWKLAEQFQTTVAALKEINNLTSDVLSVGQILIIPAAGGTGQAPAPSVSQPSATPTAPGTTVQHTVVSGDTLSGIAARYGSTVTAIRQANNLSSDLIRVGQTLTVPGGTTQTAPAPSQPSTAPATTTVQHTVVSGDTLSGIAARYGSTVTAIRQANNLSSDLIRVGQTLTVPGGTTQTAPAPSQPSTAPATTTVQHTVVSGDTLSGIAARYGSTVTAIRQANQLSSDLIRVGQTLTVPGGTTQTAPSVSQPSATPTAPGTTVQHTVVSGDTLSGIAARYGSTVTAIRLANNLSSDLIRVGQTLTVPGGTVTGNQPSAVNAGHSQEDILWLARMIYCEARGESLQGQIAVGAVILNRVKSSLFPNTIKDVIFERSHGFYQFTPAATGAVLTATPNNTNMEAAVRALNGEDPTNGSLYFYNPAKTNDQWIRSRTVSTVIGNHVFAY